MRMCYNLKISKNLKSLCQKKNCELVRVYLNLIIRVNLYIRNEKSIIGKKVSPKVDVEDSVEGDVEFLSSSKSSVCLPCNSSCRNVHLKVEKKIASTYEKNHLVQNELYLSLFRSRMSQVSECIKCIAWLLIPMS